MGASADTVLADSHVQVKVVLLRLLVPLPGGLAEARAPVVGRVALAIGVVLGRAPDEPVPLGVVLGRARLLEPPVRVRTSRA